MKTQHTQGPWTRNRGWSHDCLGPNRSDMMDYRQAISARAPFTENEHGNFEEVEEQVMARAFGRTADEMEANARLIAAAPDLLKALASVVGCIEAEWGADLLPFNLNSPGDKQANEAILAARAAIAKATNGGPNE